MTDELIATNRMGKPVLLRIQSSRWLVIAGSMLAVLSLSGCDFNVVDNGANRSRLPFGAKKVRAYELSLKNEVFDQRLLLNHTNLTDEEELQTFVSVGGGAAHGVPYTGRPPCLLGLLSSLAANGECA